MSGALLLIPAGAAYSAAQPQSQPAQSAQPALAPGVQPQAVQALRNMSAYLRTLSSFQIRVATNREELDDRGAKMRFAGTVDYKIRRPNGFLIRSDESGRVRELLYDGKSLTLFTPVTGFYAHVPAPPTIRETLILAGDRYDIHPPLVDLFKWGYGDDGADRLTAGYRVGEATVNGQMADEYAFRQEGRDWRIWIARGARPVPLQIAVTSTDTPKPLTFKANLAWNTNTQFADNTFAFQAPAGSRQIGMASTQ